MRLNKEYQRQVEIDNRTNMDLSIIIYKKIPFFKFTFHYFNFIFNYFKS